MTPFAAIVTDVQGLATKGDMAGAKARITDFETAWDEAEPTLRPTNKGAWGNVDEATDAALSAVRAGTPGPAEVKASLDQLQLALANTAQRLADATPVQSVTRIATTDADGRALPCEEMLTAVRAGLATPRPPACGLPSCGLLRAPRTPGSRSGLPNQQRNARVRAGQCHALRERHPGARQRGAPAFRDADAEHVGDPSDRFHRQVEEVRDDDRGGAA